MVVHEAQGQRGKLSPTNSIGASVEDRETLAQQTGGDSNNADRADPKSVVSTTTPPQEASATDGEAATVPAKGVGSKDKDENDEVEMNAQELQEQGQFYQGENNHKYALFYYTESLRRDVHNVDCWLARAACWMKLDRMVEAVKDCNAALRLDYQCAEGYRVRAKCLQRLKRVNEAIVDMEYVHYLENLLPQPTTEPSTPGGQTGSLEHDIDGDVNEPTSAATTSSSTSSRQAGDIPSAGLDEARDYLDELRVQARLEVAKEMKDHYLALAVDPAVDEEQLKKAYRDAAMKWHPDRWSCAHPTDREMAEDCFKECSYAYQVLKDENTRVNYDKYLVHRLYDHNLPHPADAPQHYLYQKQPHQHQHAHQHAQHAHQHQHHQHNPHMANGQHQHHQHYMPQHMQQHFNHFQGQHQFNPQFNGHFHNHNHNQPPNFPNMGMGAGGLMGNRFPSHGGMY